MAIMIIITIITIAIAKASIVIVQNSMLNHPSSIEANKNKRWLSPLSTRVPVYSANDAKHPHPHLSQQQKQKPPKPHFHVVPASANKADTHTHLLQITVIQETMNVRFPVVKGHDT